MTTYTLNSGDVVTAKTPDWPTQYANRTQANKAAAKIPGAEVIQRGRPFYVRVAKPKITMQGKNLHPDFVAYINALADNCDKTPDEVYALWTKYSDDCRAFDQSAVKSEFELWYKEVLVAVKVGVLTQRADGIPA